MTDDPNIWRFTVQHPDGHPILTFVVKRESGAPAPPTPPPVRREETPPPARPNGGPPSSSVEDPRMTDPQKRYLFRLLATQGVEGKNAEEHLKHYFGVRAVRDIPKYGASQLIDQMVTDGKDKANGA